MDSYPRPEIASGLELLHVPPVQPSFPRPLLFVHGAYVGAWCWAEYFLPHFAAAGFEAYAVSLRGHGQSPGRAALSWHSIQDYVADLAEAVEAIGRPPVVIGHSMGAFVLQKYLAQQPLPGVVMLAAVPPQGLSAPSFELALREPSLLADMNSMVQLGRASAEALQRAMFAQPIDAERLARYQRLCQPESQRAIWDMTLFNPFQRGPARPVPTLYLAGELDRLIPLHYQRAGAAALGVGFESAAGLGHGLMLESSWARVADRVVAWLRDNEARFS